VLPFRDAFAVLFFVSVGMLFDPMVLITHPLAVLAIVAIILLVKAGIAFGLTRALGHDRPTAATIAAALAQIGEFSFILLILAGAILSIMANPLIFSLVAGRTSDSSRLAAPVSAEPGIGQSKPAQGHVVLVGYGRVGRLVAKAMKGGKRTMTIVEEQPDLAHEAKKSGFEVVVGNAALPEIMDLAGIARASRLLIAIPEGFEAGGIAHRARALNSGLAIIARAHSDDEVTDLEKQGADHVVMGEREIARKMLALAGSA